MEKRSSSLEQSLHNRNNTGEYTFGRVSVDAVDTYLRANDGLEPGAVVYHTSHSSDFELSTPYTEGLTIEKSTVLLRQLDSNPLVDAPDIYNDYVQDFADSTADFKRFIGYGDTLDFATSTGAIIQKAEAMRDKPHDETGAFIPQYETLLSIIDEFKSSNPHTILDPEQAGSFSGIATFLQYYQQKVNSNLQEKNTAQRIDAYRQTLAQTMRTKAMAHRFGGQANAERIAGVIENTPIVVSDPLSVLLSATRMNTGDRNGWFLRAQRLCYIDPLTIERFSSKQKVKDSYLVRVVAHELLHAATNNVYRAKSFGGEVQSEPVEVSVRSMWPQFVNEAMVEKGAYLLATTAFPMLFATSRELGQKINTKELIIRKFYSNNPNEVLSFSNIERIRTETPSSYIDFRLLVDTIMDVVDWSRAGLSRNEAEELLISAFYSHSDDKKDQDTTYRKRFMSAVNTAAHPGFINKLGLLVNIYGPSEMLDVIESPHFDPTNPEDLPIPYSVTVASRLEESYDNVFTLRKRISRLESAQKRDEAALSAKRKALEVNEAKADLRDNLFFAIDALKIILRHKYGRRNRTVQGNELILFHLFGDDDVSSEYESYPIEVAELTEAKKEYTEWLALQEKHKSTILKREPLTES